MYKTTNKLPLLFLHVLRDAKCAQLVCSSDTYIMHDIQPFIPLNNNEFEVT